MRMQALQNPTLLSDYLTRGLMKVVPQTIKVGLGIPERGVQVGDTGWDGMDGEF